MSNIASYSLNTESFRVTILNYLIKSVWSFVDNGFKVTFPTNGKKLLKILEHILRFLHNSDFRQLKAWTYLTDLKLERLISWLKSTGINLKVLKCKILWDLPELLDVTGFNHLVRQIIGVNVEENFIRALRYKIFWYLI